MVLVDTSVWSLALRKKELQKGLQEQAVARLRAVIEQGQAVMCGMIRQELLSGVRHEAQLVRLRDLIRPYVDLEPTRHTYEQAAEISNRCRRQGVQGSHVDFLLTALAIEHQTPLLTVDNDFHHIAPHCSLQLMN